MIIQIDIHPLVLSQAIQLWSVKYKNPSCIDDVIAQCICDIAHHEREKSNQIEDQKK